MKLYNVVTAAMVLSLSLGAPAFGQYQPPPAPAERQATEQPGILKEIGVDQKLDNQVPLDLEFTDEHGKKVTLGDYAGERPIVLSLVYYGCPMLCGQVLNGLTRSLKMLKDVPMVAGKDFEVVTLSFDPSEKPELAMEKKKNFVKEYDQKDAEKHWHWLTGDEENIKKVADAVGFRYAWDEKQQQYAHASAIFLLTPDGKVSRYFFGIEYSPKDMRLGLTEASNGKIGGPVEKVLLFCYHYDATLGKYSMMVMRLIQVGGILTLLALGSFMFVMLRKDFKAGPKAETTNT
jgi:protein SCO1/2